MVRTKAFYNSNSIYKLELEINEWLRKMEEKEPTFHLISIDMPRVSDALIAYYVETEEERKRWENLNVREVMPVLKGE